MATRVAAETKVYVEFRGIMLFVADRAHLDRVMLPMAEAGTQPRDGRAGQPDGDPPARIGEHADQSPARPHTAGLAIVSAGRVRARLHPLRGTVTFRDAKASGSSKPEDKRCGFTRVGNLAPLARVTNASPPATHDLRLVEAGDADYAQRVAAVVRFEGGSTRPSFDSDSDLVWTFTEAFQRHGIPGKRLTLRYGWEPADGPVTITISPVPAASERPEGMDETGVMTVQPGDTVYVYDLDDQYFDDRSEIRLPEREDLDEPEVGTTPRFEVDYDFRWLYQLLRPGASEGLPRWLDRGRFKGTQHHDPRALPAPQWNHVAAVAPAGVVGVNVMRPNVSTCYGAYWVER